MSATAGAPGAAVRPVQAARAGRRARSAFSALLVYYWAMQFADAPAPGSEPRGGLLYFLYIVPVAAFAVPLLISVLLRGQLSRPGIWVAVYMAIVCAVGASRGDASTVATTGLFCSVVIVVFSLRLAPSLGLLNRLLLASIPVNAVAFLLGASVYAVVPGYSKDPELWWRVALFPQVATSAYFALVVCFANLIRSRAPWRRTCIACSAYFVVFAGIRSALIAAGIAAAYLVLVRRGHLRRVRSQLLFVGGSLLVFVASLFMTQLLLILPVFNNATLNVYLFRNAGGFGSEAEATQAVFRTWLWSEHFRLASQNPLLGIGTFDFFQVSAFDPGFSDLSNGSEAFLTGLFARVGLPVVLLIAGIGAAMRRGIRAGDMTPPVAGLFVFVAMLAYGSFVNVYDFVFLVMLGLLAAPMLRSPGVPGSSERGGRVPLIASDA